MLKAIYLIFLPYSVLCGKLKGAVVHLYEHKISGQILCEHWSFGSKNRLIEIKL